MQDNQTQHRWKKPLAVLVSLLLLCALVLQFPVWNAWREYQGCPSYYGLHIGYLLELSFAGTPWERAQGEEILSQSEEAFTAVGLTGTQAAAQYAALSKYTPAQESDTAYDNLELKLLSAHLGKENGCLWVQISYGCDSPSGQEERSVQAVRWDVEQTDGQWTVTAVHQAP